MRPGFEPEPVESREYNRFDAELRHDAERRYDSDPRHEPDPRFEPDRRFEPDGRFESDQRFAPEPPRFDGEPQRFTPEPQRFAPEPQRFDPRRSGFEADQGGRYEGEPHRFEPEPPQFGAAPVAQRPPEPQRPPEYQRPPEPERPAGVYGGGNRFESGLEPGRHGKVDMTAEIPAADSPFTPDDLHRLDQARQTFTVRRFGSGYDPAQVTRLFDAIAATMSGRATVQVSDSELDPGQFSLVQGGLFEAEVDTALRSVRDMFARKGIAR